MDLISQNNYNLTNLAKINIMLGKNGSGKSTLLKKIEAILSQQNLGEVVYVTPERGGVLQYDSNIEQNATSNPSFAVGQRRRNQWNQFKNHSLLQYRQLELLSLRELEGNMALRNDPAYSFDTVVSKINDLLDNVKIERVAGDFQIKLKSTNTGINAAEISSGESELISLAIECLKFEKTSVLGRQNLLLLDEPDVHLHPDLQSKFVIFLRDLVSTNKFNIIIATHSTAILGALLNYADARFAVLKNGSIEAAFKPIDEVYRNILPIFGAHPLSNIFNENPILLVEGEDDVRIVQQAIRSANGSLKFYPCSVNGKDQFANYEPVVREIISGVYDNGKAFSLRDRDDDGEYIDDQLPLIRFRLSCRAAENIILTDEVLNTLNTNWQQLQAEIENWINNHDAQHANYACLVQFRNSGYDRKTFDLKTIRNVIVGLTPSNKPWEIAVGQAIAQVVTGTIPKDMHDYKLCNFLGEKFSNHLRP